MGLRRTEQIRVPERLKLDLPHPSRQPASTNKTGDMGENVSMLSKPSVRSRSSISVAIQGRPPLRTIRNLVSIWGPRTKRKKSYA